MMPYIRLGGYMTQQKLNYIHYYVLAIVASILVWGALEYISICNGQNCMIDTSRLWNGLGLIALIFIPITLCIWSESINGQLKTAIDFLKRKYEEQVLIFGVLILFTLFLTSYSWFNNYWDQLVKDRTSKEYVAALVNVAIFVATIFAPIAALLLYNNWKVQHNKTLLSNEAKSLLKPLLQEQKILLILEEKFQEQCQTLNNRFTVTDTQLIRVFKTYDDTTKKNNLEHAFFNFLANEKTSKLYEKYLELGSELIEFHNDCCTNLKTYTSVKDEYQNKLDDVKNTMYRLTYDLKSYILIK